MESATDIVQKTVYMHGFRVSDTSVHLNEDYMTYPVLRSVRKTRESISDNDIHEAKQQWPLRVLTYHKPHLTSGMLMSVLYRDRRSNAYRFPCLREK